VAKNVPKRLKMMNLGDGGLAVPVEKSRKSLRQA
jgi:hypothetical protein